MTQRRKTTRKDISKKRATDVKTNQRVVMPLPREEFCNEKGDQKQTSLTKQESRRPEEPEEKSERWRHCH